VRGKPRTYGALRQCAVQSQAGATSSAPASRAPAATPTWPVRRSGCPPRRNESTVGTGLAPYGAFPVKLVHSRRGIVRGKPRTYEALRQRAVQSRVGAYILCARIQSTSGDPALADSPERVPPVREQICRRYGACPVRRFPGEVSCIPGEVSCGASPAPTEHCANAPFNHRQGLRPPRPHPEHQRRPRPGRFAGAGATRKGTNLS